MDLVQLAASIITCGRSSAGSETSDLVNLDNAATTPALGLVKQAVDRALLTYGAVSRGSGWNSELSTEVYERCRQEIVDFVGADGADHLVVFGRSTTEMINVLANRLRLEADDAIIVTGIEHHSNDLPWRRVARVLRAEVERDGYLTLDSVQRCFCRTRKVKVLAVSGASNVTGQVPDIRALAAMAHGYGAMIFVDAAQLVAHRRLQMGSGESALDFVAFSGHKMYAPFGSAALVGRRDVFDCTAPYNVGGGVVSRVTAQDVIWNESPWKEEAGTPNLLGTVALAQASRLLRAVTLDAIQAHERKLMQRLLQRLRSTEGLVLYGCIDQADRIGVLAFNIRGIDHGRVARILSIDYGIAVRSGCFCAQPLVARLLGEEVHTQVPFLPSEGGRPTAGPGMVRLSLGLYNSDVDVERACDAIQQIAANPAAALQKDLDREPRSVQLSMALDQVFSLNPPL